jgi:flagellar hook assembly protein FlgD
MLNPNPVTTGLAQIKLSLAAAGDVNINIYNIKGQLVKTINHNQLATGTHILQINAADLSNGNYVLSVDMGSRSEVARFVVMK